MNDVSGRAPAATARVASSVATGLSGGRSSDDHSPDSGVTPGVATTAGVPSVVGVVAGPGTTLGGVGLAHEASSDAVTRTASRRPVRVHRVVPGPLGRRVRMLGISYAPVAAVQGPLVATGGVTPNPGRA